MPGKAEIKLKALQPTAKREMVSPLVAQGAPNALTWEGRDAYRQAKQTLMLLGLAAGYPRDMLDNDLGREFDRLEYRKRYGLNPGEPLSKRNDYGE